MNLGVDLGTSRIIIYDPTRGVVLDEPAVIAVAASDGHVVAWGAEAEAMLGRTPDTIVAARPVQNGVIAEYELAEKLLRCCLAQVCSARITKPCVAVSVAEKVTEVEQRSFIEAVI
jgi:rod shape-determining protein MreB